MSEPMGHINRELYLIRTHLTGLASTAVESPLPPMPPIGTGEGESGYYGTGGTDTSEIDNTEIDARREDMCRGAGVALEVHRKIALLFANTGYTAGTAAAGSLATAVAGMFAASMAFPPALPVVMLSVLGAIGVGLIFWNAGDYADLYEQLSQGTAYKSALASANHPQEFWLWYKENYPIAHEATDKAIVTYLAWVTLTFRWSAEKMAAQSNDCNPLLSQRTFHWKREGSGFDAYTETKSYVGNAGFNAGRALSGDGVVGGGFVYTGSFSGSGATGDLVLSPVSNMTLPCSLHVENFTMPFGGYPAIVKIWHNPVEIFPLMSLNPNVWDSVLGLPNETTSIAEGVSTVRFGSCFTIERSGVGNWSTTGLSLRWPSWWAV